MAVINWNTVPDYDEWGVDNWWSCEDWITWHKKLVEHFGKKIANDIWNYAFAKSGNLSGNLDCRTFNSSFRTYVSSNGLEPYANAGILTPVLEGYGTASDLVSGALKTTSSVGKGLFGGIDTLFGGGNFKKTLSVVMILGGLVGVAYVYNSFKRR